MGWTVALLGLACRSEEGPGFYRWTDDEGRVLYTTRRAWVPRSHRHTAIAVVPPPPPAPQAGVEPPPPEAGLVAPTRFPKAPPQTGSPGGYVIQLKAMAPGEAQGPVPAVPALEGYEVYLSPIERDGVVWTRLRVGFFPTRGAAEGALARLAGSFPGAWIDRAAPEPPSPASRPEGSYAIQLLAIPGSSPLPELPPLALPPGTLLYSAPFHRDGERWQRLRVGFFATRADARTAADELAPLFPGAWVTTADAAERVAAPGSRITAPR